MSDINHKGKRPSSIISLSATSGSEEIKRLTPLIIMIFYIYLARVFILVDQGSAATFLKYLSFKYNVNGPAILIADITAYAALVAGLLLFYISKSLFVRCASYVLTFLTLALHLGYKSVNMYGYGLLEASKLIAEYRFAQDALSTFMPHYLWQLMYSLAVTIIIVLVSMMIRRRISAYLPAAIIALPLLYIVYWGVYWGDFLWIEQKVFPAVYKVPIVTLDAYSQKLYTGPRKEPLIKPTEKNPASNIILIVDESIRGDMLGINGNVKDTTPFLETMKKGLYNYGIASAATNCSDESNLVLLSGIKLEQLPDREHTSLKNPNIFQYAKEAGYTTYYIDGQNPRDRYHNYMSNHDMSHIDNYYQMKKIYKGIPRHDIDYKIIHTIDEILKKDALAFVYVLKSGAHFTYEISYPPENKIFTPTVTEAEMWWSRKTDLILNSYYNAILWTVDGFFKKFLSVAEGHGVWTIYTSDHGQSFSKKRTHCSTVDPPNGQANVPLMIIPPPADSDLRRELDANYTANIDMLTHYELFPSLLYIMGYEKSRIKELYGRTVFERIDRLPNERRFASGNIFGNGIFGKNIFNSTLGTN